MFFFNSANDYVKFNIALHKHSSPGTIHLINYKRLHISASGTAQTVARRFFMFQKDGATAHRARDTVTFLEQERWEKCVVV